MARQWDEARGTKCSRDAGHRFKTGDRVWSVTIPGGRIRKEYCPDCAVAHWGAPADTGEIRDARDDLALALGRGPDDGEEAIAAREADDVARGDDWQRFDDDILAGIFGDK